MGPLPYDPGPKPTKPPPAPGSKIVFEVAGWPPWKDISFSIRNSRSRQYSQFMRLRRVAIAAMAGRARYEGPVELDVRICGPEEARKRSLTDYMGGIMDALDGSHGATFTYLPIVYEDDCQVSDVRAMFRRAAEPSYRVKVVFVK